MFADLQRDTDYNNGQFRNTSGKDNYSISRKQIWNDWAPDRHMDYLSIFPTLIFCFNGMFRYSNKKESNAVKRIEWDMYF